MRTCQPALPSPPRPPPPPSLQARNVSAPIRPREFEWGPDDDAIGDAITVAPAATSAPAQAEMAKGDDPAPKP